MTAFDAPLLSVRDLKVTIPVGRSGNATLIENIEFDVYKGRTLGIVGESGSGKSMTSLAIMGLLPPTAVATGSVRLGADELLGRSERQLRAYRGNRIAMIFQDPLSSLNPYYTIGVQIVETYRAHMGGSHKAAHAVAVDLLDQVGIREPARRVDQYPHELSGGMRQRAMIAMAICCEPELIIADESTTALDVTVQAQVLELLDDLQKQTGVGMIFISHDLAVVGSIADEVLVMRRGGIIETGSTRELFTDPQTEYTQELLNALPRIERQAQP